MMRMRKRKKRQKRQKQIRKEQDREGSEDDSFTDQVRKDMMERMMNNR